MLQSQLCFHILFASSFPLLSRCETFWNFVYTPTPIFLGNLTFLFCSALAPFSLELVCNVQNAFPLRRHSMLEPFSRLTERGREGERERNTGLLSPCQQCTDPLLQPYVPRACMTSVNMRLKYLSKCTQQLICPVPLQQRAAQTQPLTTEERKKTRQRKKEKESLLADYRDV